jgi:hypothetical protein
MSKCRPTTTSNTLSIESAGVVVRDIRERDTATNEERRFVEIRIPYESLRDNKEVQILFQDIVYIATEEDPE